jgi:adenylate kinase family enzyme
MTAGGAVAHRRFQVRGISGSGKTTVAAELARRLGAPHIELDALHWGPDWTQASAEELRARVAPLLEGERWVVDGSYSAKLGSLVADRVETVVWLDPPLHVALVRLFRRTRGRIRSREELWAGNRETWRGAALGTESLFLWACRSWLRQRRGIPRSVPPEKLVRLRSDEETRRWLAGLGG